MVNVNHLILWTSHSYRYHKNFPLSASPLLNQSTLRYKYIEVTIMISLVVLSKGTFIILLSSHSIKINLFMPCWLYLQLFFVKLESLVKSLRSVWVRLTVSYNHFSFWTFQPIVHLYLAWISS